MRNQKSLETVLEKFRDMKHEKFNLSKNKKRWTVILFCCALLGVISGIAGLVLSSLNFAGFLATNWISTFLVAIAFPMMMLAAHSMDKIAEIDQAQRFISKVKKDRKNYQTYQWQMSEAD